MRRPIQVVLLITAMLCMVANVLGQTRRIDSLKGALSNQPDKTKRTELLIALCEEGSSMSADSLYTHALQLKQLATTGKSDERLQGDFYIARSLLKRGLLDSAYQLVVSSLKWLSENNRKQTPVYRKFSSTKGNLLIRRNAYKEAIEEYHALLSNAERNSDHIFQVIAKNGIGWAYMEMGRYQEALNWFRSATRNNIVAVNGKYSVLINSNMAAVYNSIGHNDSAMYRIEQAIVAATKNEDLTALANALNIKASLFIDRNEPRLAEAPLNQALKLRKTVGDPFYIVSDIAQLASYYANNGKPEKGIDLCLQGIQLARQYKFTAKLRLLYTTLAENYKAAGDLANYSTTLEKLLVLNDSVYSQNTAEAVAEIHGRYELQKKENIIIRQKLDLVQKNYLFYSALGLLLITGLFSFILFRNYRRKQKMRIDLIRAEEKRLVEHAIKEAEENERKRIAADLHDNLGVYAAAIASNVDNAMDTSGHGELAMAELKTNSQAMVAQLSDTIWALKKDTLSLTALSDRVKVFLQRLQPSYPKVCMEVKEKIANDIKLTPSQAYHLFSIVQEGVNNAIKHSQCSEIGIHIEGSLSWKVCITDNGKGFGANTNDVSESNGLYNMRARAELNKWKIEWIRNIPTGTSVIIHPEKTDADA